VSESKVVKLAGFTQEGVRQLAKLSSSAVMTLSYLLDPVRLRVEHGRPPYVHATHKMMSEELEVSVSAVNHRLQELRNNVMILQAGQGVIMMNPRMVVSCTHDFLHLERKRAEYNEMSRKFFSWNERRRSTGTYVGSLKKREVKALKVAGSSPLGDESTIDLNKERATK
jgi:hypothetical protein